MNANATDRTDTVDTETAEGKAKPIAIRLVPANNSDQPVLANYSTVHPAPGMVMIDFGFLEPAVLAALPRVAKRGGKLPESLNGRLAVRVAMGYAGVAALQQQLTRLLTEMAKAAEGRTDGKRGEGSHG